MRHKSMHNVNLRPSSFDPLQLEKERMLHPKLGKCLVVSLSLIFFTIHEFQYKTASPLMKLDALLQIMFGKSRIWINSK